MIKKVAHISDVHIRTFKRQDEYKEGFKKLFKSLREEFKDLPFEERRIVITGDWAHQKINVSNEYYLLSAWVFNKLSKIGKVVIIAGNHDMLEANKDRVDSISPIIQMIDNPNIIYYKNKGCFEDENLVWCVYSVFENNDRPDIEKAKEQFGLDKKYIGLYHAPVTGSKTALGYEFKDGAEPQTFYGLDSVMLGDIHLYQTFQFGDKTKGAYASSLFQQDFGEGISNHGYLMWETENLTHEFKNIESDYGFYHFKIKSVNDLKENKEIFVNK